MNATTIERPATATEVAAVVENERKLQTAVANISNMSLEALKQIVGLSKVALNALESPSGHEDLESLAMTLDVIWTLAGLAENNIACEAEDVGCETFTPSWIRRSHAAS